MMLIGQFEVDGCHFDGDRAQCGLGDHQGGRQGGGTGVARNMLLDHWKVTLVIEMVMGE